MSSKVTGLIMEELPEVDGIIPGFRVRQVGDTYLDVLHMLFGNKRLVVTPVKTQWCYVGGWCYQGPQAFLVAVQQCLVWPEDDLTHVPWGWHKDVTTGQRQPEFFDGARVLDLSEVTL